MTADPITRLNAALEGRCTIEREIAEGGGSEASGSLPVSSAAGGEGFTFKRPIALGRAYLQSQEPSDPVVPGLE